MWLPILEVPGSTLRPESSASTVTKLRTGQPVNRVAIPSRFRDHSPLHIIPTCVGAHPPSYPMNILVSFAEAKRSERKANCSPPSVVKVKK
jgi:hypothetical protein